MLLLEDIRPAAQGDALRSCTEEEAAAVVRSLARVHAATWGREGMPPWTARVVLADEWAVRLDAAAARLPWILTPGVRDALHATPDRARHAVETLAAGERAWIHGDAHLDNVLFRPDGTAVLLDWSGVVAGPPAVDLARLLTEGVNAGARGKLAERLIEAYAKELAAGGVSLAADGLRRAVAAALVLLVQTAVSWAARDVDREPVERVRHLQENLLRSVLEWASNEDMSPLTRPA